jgi:hypothetical protein
LDGVAHVDRSPWVMLGDPLELCAEVTLGVGEPLDSHAVRPAARCSSSARC